MCEVQRSTFKVNPLSPPFIKGGLGGFGARSEVQ
ncbi:hypothetical protein MELA_00391 [Candidatus Methylomirabilis lanthanidiphila]|uniref:Uncharacterized protein n=1 Tax=Candidatus Methylomirabilis lanthanidiphila TaxID=2211376 RepID=A0A564ZGK4_9BACT|nr:hypothetical protein MELA_00391 [Candidatus Methylomirabilis lanthanidiphila]